MALLLKVNGCVFKRSICRTTLARYDMVPMYMNSANYLKFAQDTFSKEKALVEKLGLMRQP